MKKVERVMQRRETTLYTAEFREKAVAKYRALAGRKSQHEVADLLNVKHETFRRWCKDAGKPGRTVSAQLVALRTEVDRLREVSVTLARVVSQLVAGKGKRSAP